jgi:cysteine desulfurase
VQSKPVYLDYNATTPIDREAVDAMLPYLTEHFGNPSSSHAYGQATKQAVENGRRQLAALINAAPTEVIFTGGCTESNNSIIRGLAEQTSAEGRHIITSAVEHPAILEPCAYLAAHGFDITILPVDNVGRVDPADVERAIRPDTILISIMLANNEVGTIQPIAEIARIAKARGIAIHTDAAQAIGKIPVDVDLLNVDYLSIAGHKFYAPKGIGAIYARGGHFPHWMRGAGHEFGRRAGTENVSHIVGVGKAAEVARRDFDITMLRMRTLRDRLWQGLSARIEEVRRNGHTERCLPNTLSVSFRNVQANALLGQIEDRVAASAGAACHADQVTVSEVLKAMNVPMDYAMGTLRLTLGKPTTEQEIDTTIEVIASKVAALRSTVS